MKPAAAILLLCAMVLGACSNADRAAKTTAKLFAKQWAQINLKNINGYQPLVFTRPDSIILSYRNDARYMQLEDSVMGIEALRFQEMGENFRQYKQRETSGFYAKIQAVYRKKQHYIAKKLKPRFVGYKIEHEFLRRDTQGWQKQEKLVLCFNREGKLTGVLR